MAKKTPKPDGIPIEKYLVRTEFKHELEEMMQPDRRYEEPERFALLTQSQINSLDERKRMADAFLEAVCFNASENVRLNQKQALASARGGQETAKIKTEELQHRNKLIEQAARSMLDSGRDRRNIAAVLAPRFSLGEQQIRNILNKACI